MTSNRWGGVALDVGVSSDIFNPHPPHATIAAPGRFDPRDVTPADGDSISTGDDSNIGASDTNGQFSLADALPMGSGLFQAGSLSLSALVSSSEATSPTLPDTSTVSDAAVNAAAMQADPDLPIGSAVPIAFSKVFAGSEITDYSDSSLSQAHSGFAGVERQLAYTNQIIGGPGVTPQKVFNDSATSVADGIVQSAGVNQVGVSLASSAETLAENQTANAAASGAAQAVGVFQIQGISTPGILSVNQYCPTGSTPSLVSLLSEEKIDGENWTVLSSGAHERHIGRHVASYSKLEQTSTHPAPSRRTSGEVT